MVVKIVTKRCVDDTGAFPDTVSARATKHLVELHATLQRGHRAALVFAVLQAGITRLAPAKDVDPAYASALRRAMTSGEQVYTLLHDINLNGPYPVAAHRWYANSLCSSP